MGDKIRYDIPLLDCAKNGVIGGITLGTVAGLTFYLAKDPAPACELFSRGMDAASSYVSNTDFSSLNPEEMGKRVVYGSVGWLKDALV